MTDSVTIGSAGTVGPAGDPGSRRVAAPACVHDGLAVYDLGAGPPLLVMPNPQGTVRAPEACSPLVELPLGLGRRVVTFDPPGRRPCPSGAWPGAGAAGRDDRVAP
jgi:hypothetical protein